MSSFALLFADLPDPRAANTRHSLLEVIFIALMAVLCGAESCTDMAEFGRAKRPLLQSLLKMPHGVPSHDTFSRVFRLLDPGAFEAAFARFTRTFAQALKGAALKGVVALDGKALRGAYLKGRRHNPLHLVNVWAAEARLVVGQQEAPGRNEVAGALNALALLRLSGCLVTADALHCRPDIARAIRAQGGEYVLALKNNQPRLLAEARARLDRGQDSFVQETTAHGRCEQRRARVVAVPDLPERCGFEGAVGLGRLESRRQAGDGPETVLVRHFVLSRLMSGEELVRVVRQHWTIENQLHWVLDVVLNEDRARTRQGYGGQNLALLRRWALNLLHAHPDPASLRRKVKRAGWDEAFLLSLIAHMQ